MAKIRGVILERRGKLVSVLTEEGDFRQFKWKKQGEPGDRITWNDYRELAVYVGSVLTLFTIMFLISSYFAVAVYTEISFNPAVEMGINRWGMAVSLKGRNEEGEKITGSIPWRGKTARRVAVMVLAEAFREGYFRDKAGEVVLVAVPVKPQEETRTRGIVKEIRSEYGTFAARQNIDLRVVSYLAALEARSEAQKRNITLREVIEERGGR